MSSGICFLFLFVINLHSFGQTVAHKRASSLGKGMNISWLEHYWLGNTRNQQMDYLDHSPEMMLKRKTDLLKMVELGISTVRLPVCFDRWEDRVAPFKIDSVSYFGVVDSMIRWTAALNMKIIIDYQHGQLRDQKFSADTTRLNALWLQIAAHFSYTNPDQVLFVAFNEPHEINNEQWRIAATSVVATIRKHCPKHTILIGAADYNSLPALLKFTPLEDKNIIYSFHFYEPFIFTHQGAPWTGNATSTVNIEFVQPDNIHQLPTLAPKAKGTWGENGLKDFPYWVSSDKIESQIKKIAYWGLINHVPVYCGEFGSYRGANAKSRAAHLKRLRNDFENNHINYAWWEWDRNFSLLYDNKMPLIFQEAWGVKNVQPVPFWEYLVTESKEHFLFQTIDRIGEGKIYVRTMDRKTVGSFKLTKGVCFIKTSGMPKELLKVSIWDNNTKLRGTSLIDLRPK